MPEPADWAQAVRAVGVTLLSMAAAALAASFAVALADHQWRPAVTLGLFVISLVGAACALFRAYIRHSPRHKGRH